jgi:hypothetical protein
MSKKNLSESIRDWALAHHVDAELYELLSFVRDVESLEETARWTVDQIRVAAQLPKKEQYEHCLIWANQLEKCLNAQVKEEAEKK